MKRFFALSLVGVLVLTVAFIPPVTAAQTFEATPGGVREMAAEDSYNQDVNQVMTFYAGDVEVINSLIANNGLNATPADTTQPITSLPADWWEGIIWGGYPQQRILDLSLVFRGLAGDLNLSGLMLLHSINIENNHITSLVLHDMPQLFSVRACGNNILHLELSNLPNLWLLDATDNFIMLPILYNLPQLSHINLALTRVSHLQDKSMIK